MREMIISMETTYIILIACVVVVAAITALVVRSIERRRAEADLKIRLLEVQNEYSGEIARLRSSMESQEKAHQHAQEIQEAAHQQAIETLEKHHRQALEAQEQRHKEAAAAQEKLHSEAITSQQQRFDETIAKVSAQMKSATDEMLKARQKEFSETSSSNIGQIVNPLKETIDAMKKAMNESTIEQTKMSESMKTSVEHMMRQSEAAKQSADELARAFKHGTKMQGDWGETVLDELLQSQGLTRGIHYDIQETLSDAMGNTVRSEDGHLMRPDVILHLDNKRDVIIDSKVSLTAFVSFANAENEADRKSALTAHIDSIWKHVKELSAKNYASYVKPPKIRMDYVIMFVPHTGALWTALNEKPDLWRKAMDMNVFIADEQTLFAALRIINLTWTQIAQAQNHEKVFELANEMIDRVGQFVKKYEALGKALGKAQEAYEDGEKKLAPQGQSILLTAGKLLKLGAKQSDRNPIPVADDTLEGLQIGDKEQNNI